MKRDCDSLEAALAEATDLYNEATRAIAGLAEEPLVPCGGGCIGHFGPKATAMYRRGLDQFEALLAAKRRRELDAVPLPEAGAGKAVTG